MLNSSLEIARGFAALWVFIYHIRLGIESGWFRRFADAGFLGVPAFFVISGYCMMASSRGILARRQGPGTFLKRRFLRIFPPFWASIVVVLAIPFLSAIILGLIYGVYRWPTPRWLGFSATDWVALVTLTKGLATSGAAHKPWLAVNSVYWTLAIEFQFYLVVAFALLFRRGFHLALLGATAGCALFWLRFGQAATGLFPQYWPMFAFGLLLFFMLDHGIRPALLFRRWTKRLSGLATAAILAFAVGLAMYRPSESLERQTLFALLCCLAFWASGAVEPAFPKAWLPSRALLGLGKMSYSVYLLHIQVVSFVTMLMTPFVPRTGNLPHVLHVLGAIGLIYVFYRYCERRYIPSRAAARPARMPAGQTPEPYEPALPVR